MYDSECLECNVTDIKQVTDKHMTEQAGQEGHKLWRAATRMANIKYREPTKPRNK